MRISIYLAVSVMIIFLSSSCEEIQNKDYKVTPSAYGKPNHIMLVANDYLWNGVTGDTFKSHFEALYPVTPQEEPIYTVRHAKPLEFKDTKIFKTHRAIIILAALDDKNDWASDLVRKTLGEKNVERAATDPNYRMAIHKDRWASGQLVIYWFAPNRSELLKTVKKDYQRVMDEINKEDTKLYLEQIYIPGQNVKATKLLAEEFGVEAKIPREYVVAHKDSSVIWMRRETNTISSNLFVARMPLTDSTRAIPEHHKYIRNKMSKKYFATWVEDSYMQIDDRVLPMYYESMLLDGKQTLQARGLWGMVNDFMGGSFVTYMIEDPKNKQVIFLDGFIHAPGQKKRPEMRKLDMIFSTFSVKEK